MRNIQIQSLIENLKKTSIEQKVNIWKRIACELEKPTKKRRAVNLSKINRYIKNNDTVIVPGKVLGMGELDKKVTIAAYTFSGQAISKILSSGSHAVSIEELLKKNPKGSKIRIIG
ncbi:50S ribosomal protein L18e [Candidatus Woesearchaeota archaeon]|nr:50S ribosomal protein L18e [Candidatus Woesearchaeota archaeon]